MKLVNTKLGINVEIPEKNPLIIALENKEVMRSAISELLSQFDGEDGDFILSNENGILKIDKSIELIFNPFLIDFNSKKILNKLYSDLQNVANENFPIEKNKILTEIIEYIDEIIISGSTDNIDYEYEKSWVDFFKFLNIRISADYDSLNEKLVNYIKTIHNLLKVDIFIFVNIKSFLTDEELLGLYEYARYNEIKLILIESKQDNQLVNEKYYIIDKDLCIIE